MVKKTIINVKETHGYHPYMAKAILGLLNKITNENVITGLTQNNVKPLIKASVEYLGEKDDGVNSQTKNGFLSSAFCKNTFDLQQVSEVFQELHPNSKVAIATAGMIPSRVLGELPILKSYTDFHHEMISKIIFTGDTFVTNHKRQTHADVIQELKSSFGLRTVAADIKSGNNMTKHLMSGTIGQVTYKDNTQISVPNNYCDLVEFNNKRRIELRILNAFLSDYKEMPNNQKEAYLFYVNEMQPLFDAIPCNPVENHIKLEQILIKIHSLPQLPRRPSFITIVNLDQDRPFSEKEELFIDKIIPFIDGNIFKNQKSFDRFFAKAVKIYHQTIDDKTTNKLQLLKGTEWEFTFIDTIENIF